jgi:Mlc titration factor MtfA (ptsG expression regulator)
MQALNRLFVIASELDEHGMTHAADVVTDVMKRIAQQTPEEVLQMAPSLHSVGKYEENAWKQAFGEKYQRFQRLVEVAKDKRTSMDGANAANAQGLHDEMMYMASNYLKDDPDVFQIMKWVATNYKGLFGGDAA